MRHFSVLNLFNLVAITARASTSRTTQVMRSRTTTTREITAGRRGLREVVGNGRQLDGAACEVNNNVRFCAHGSHALGAAAGNYMVV